MNGNNNKSNYTTTIIFLTFHSGYSCGRSLPGCICEPGSTNRHPLSFVTVCIAVHVATILSAGRNAK